MSGLVLRLRLWLRLRLRLRLWLWLRLRLRCCLLGGVLLRLFLGLRIGGLLLRCLRRIGGLLLLVRLRLRLRLLFFLSFEPAPPLFLCLSLFILLVNKRKKNLFIIRKVFVKQTTWLYLQLFNDNFCHHCAKPKRVQFCCYFIKFDNDFYI